MKFLLFIMISSLIYHQASWAENIKDKIPNSIELPDTNFIKKLDDLANNQRTNEFNSQLESPIENKDITDPTKNTTSPFTISYFLFVNGPGITQETHSVPPNELGNPDFTGLNSFNVISFRYKFSEKYNFDFQTRSRVVFNNGVDTDNFSWFIWESPRAGISGKLFSGKNWNISGAVNSDLPYFLPDPLTGYTARRREVLFNPGMFANYNYKDPESSFSYDVLLTPRFFFYKDKDKIEPEAERAGFLGKNKPHLVISLSPSTNYHVNDWLAWSVATNIQYIKQVGSDWDPSDATLLTNSRNSKWVVDAIPLMIGPKFNIHKSLHIFSFVQIFPLSKQRESYSTGKKASFEDTVSFGMWVNGLVF